MERRLEALYQAFLCERAVAELAAFVVSNDTNLGAETLDHTLALPGTERHRVLDVET